MDRQRRMNMDKDKPDEQFLPETVDERVEKLLQMPNQHDLRTHPNARLAQDLALTHQENRQILEQVWQRLVTHSIVTQAAVDAPPLFDERTQSMQPIVKRSPPRPGWQRLS